MEEYLNALGNPEETEPPRAVQACHGSLQMSAGMFGVRRWTCRATFTTRFGQVVDLFMFATDLGIGVFGREILSGVGSVFAHGS